VRLKLRHGLQNRASGGNMPNKPTSIKMEPITERDKDAVERNKKLALIFCLCVDFGSTVLGKR